MAVAYSILPSEIDFQDYTFDFEEFVRSEVGLDITNSAKKNGETGDNICRFFLKGHCSKGNSCQFRHIRTDPSKAVVCKHWLRGLCKKGDNCEFLHEYNLRKMPECWFYSKYGECNNGAECIYLHIDPESKIKDCPWYARGFCKHGPNCRHKHTRKVICQNYVTGWCPQGPNCPNGHPKYELPPPNWDDGQGARPIVQDRTFERHETSRPDTETPTFRNVEDVTCFKNLSTIMAKEDRDLCCCCIRLRLAVGVISLVYLAVTAATTYQKYVANNIGDGTAKAIIYVSCGLQVLIAILGLISSITKSVNITKAFSFSWWFLTLIVLGLSIVNVVFVAKNDKEAIKAECQNDILASDGTAVTDSQIDSCYRTTVIVSAVVLGVQFLIMCLIGWVIQRFLREVKQDAAVEAALKAVDDGDV
ncbi:hypothetical protein BGZ46_003400 [Entomortierella lignicola]|nr:hypothetical protein BGZ46_003400 [Entomortierella lignicola]